MQVQRLRSIEWQPAGITAVATSPKLDRVVVSRENGEIEIWGVQPRWHLETVISGFEGQATRSLAVGDSDQFFAATFSGRISVYSIKTGELYGFADAPGGAVWAISLNSAKDTLAAACDDGSVRLFSVTSRTVDYFRTLERLQERALAVAWFPDGNSVVAGASDGSMRVISLQSGRSVASCSAGTGASVLCLAVAADGTIISGSATGTTQFWSSNGGLEAALPAHRGPVRAIAIAPNGLVFASGADPRIAAFARIEATGRWVHSCSRGGHTHDVAALAVLGTELVSGGVDTMMCVYDTTRFNALKPRRVEPFRAGSVSFAADGRTCLALHSRRIELWDIPTTPTPVAADTPLSDKKPVPTKAAASSPRRRLVLEPSGGRNMSCAALSPQARHLAVSDNHSCRVFAVVSDPSGNVTVQKAATHPACTSVLFTADGNSLLCAHADGSVSLRPALPTAGASRVTSTHVFDAHRSTQTSIAALAVSTDGQWAASAAADGTVLIFNLDALRTSGIVRLGSSVLALSFDEAASVLVAVTAAHDVALIDVEHGSVSPRSDAFNAALPRALRARHDPVLGASVRGEDVLVWGAGYVCRLSLSFASETGTSAGPAAAAPVGNGHIAAAAEPTPRKRKQGSSVEPAAAAAAATPSGKKIRAKAGAAAVVVDTPLPPAPVPEPPASSKECGRVVDRLGPLLYAGFSRGGALMLAERPWLQVQAQLPDVLDRPRFGT